MSVVEDLGKHAAAQIGGVIGRTQNLVPPGKERAAISIQCAVGVVAMAVGDLIETGMSQQEAEELVIGAYKLVSGRVHK